MTRPVCSITGVGDGTGAALARRFAEGGYRGRDVGAKPAPTGSSRERGRQHQGLYLRGRGLGNAVGDSGGGARGDGPAVRACAQRRRGHVSDLSRGRSRGPGAEFPGEHDRSALPGPRVGAGHDRCGQRRHPGDGEYCCVYAAFPTRPCLRRPRRHNESWRNRWRGTWGQRACMSHTSRSMRQSTRPGPGFRSIPTNRKISSASPRPSPTRSSTSPIKIARPGCSTS